LRTIPEPKTYSEDKNITKLKPFMQGVPTIQSINESLPINLSEKRYKDVVQEG